jgi:tetratricopeptide (TPR) repeat protein
MFGIRKGVWRLLALAIFLGSPLSLKAQAYSAGQYFNAANQLYSSRNYNQAIQYYGAVVKSNPTYAPAYQGIGNCYYALGNKQYALAYYQRAYQISPSAQLGQFIQSLQAQAASPGAGMGLQAPRPQINPSLAMGIRYFQARQYAAAIPYFQQATRQVPNDYRPFYYLGYSYYMVNQRKYGALYISVADMKQPNRSILAAASRIKSNLSDDDADWVDDQLSKYADATGLKPPAFKTKPVFGFDAGIGMDYLLSNPTQITQYVAGAGSVSLSGVTPSLLPLPTAEFFMQVNPNIELDLSGSYLPVGTLSYTWTDIAPWNDPYLPAQFYTDPNTGTWPNPADYYKVNYTTSIFTTSLGFKLLFGDPTVKAYFGAGADVSPISLTFKKSIYNGAGKLLGEDPSSSDVSGEGDYTTVAFGGHAVLGANFIISHGLSFGPYIGYKYLEASNFKNAMGTLVINQNNGDVGNSYYYNSLYPSLNTVPLDLDLSGIYGGLNVNFSF